MLTKLTQMFCYWWLLVGRGALAIVFGVLALIWPEPIKLSLVLLFGAFVLADGYFSLAVGIALYGHFKRWWAVLLEGLTGIAIGFLTFVWPNITAHVLLYFIAIWAVITGVFEIAAAIQLRRVISGEWGMVLSGLLSVVLGILLFVFPSAGAVGLIWLIGIYAIIAGLMESTFAFRVRGFWHEIESHHNQLILKGKP
jgi:uncharacterized membrane protein HdeD (DUF308 family)